MAGAIRLTKAERAIVVQMLSICHSVTSKEQRSIDSVLAKLEASEKPRGSGVPVREAVEAFREVLGQRLIAPLSGASGVWAQMQNRLNALGLSRMDCVSVAKAAAVGWKGPIRAESLVRQADKLLQESQLELPAVRGARPVEMEDL